MTRARSARRALAVAVLAVAVVACSDPSTSPANGGGTSESTSTAEGSVTTPVDPSAVQPEGFTTIQALITEADGDVCEVCLWLADDGDERSRGLMGVTDLGDAVGMAFRFDEPTLGSFYMFQTPTPLSIAWFAADGGHVGSADMAPCLDTPAGDCPVYSPDGEYTVAIEVFDGGLEALGLGPGSSVELVAGSEADRCPATS